MPIGISPYMPTANLQLLSSVLIAMTERHYSPTYFARLWGFSIKVIRDLFRNEPGVIKVNRPEELHKRGYCSMRIPESVAERVYKRITR
jgi:hypothetical protein